MTSGGLHFTVTDKTALEASQDAIWAGEDPFLAGWGEEEPGGGSGQEEAPAEEAAPAAPDSNSFKTVEEELEKHLMDKVVERVKKRLKDDNLENTLNPTPSSAKTNENVVKEGRIYRAGLKSLIKKASNDADLVDSVADFNKQAGINIPVHIYRVALTVGSVDQHRTIESFLKSCSKAMGREPDVREAKTILRLCKLLSQGQALRKHV